MVRRFILIMRKYIKNIILQRNVMFHKDKSPKVVFYHDIGKKWTPMGTSPQMFFKHMRVIVESCKLKVEGEGHMVAFDDGFRGVWEYRDELEKIVGGVKVIVFIAVRLVGQPGYLTWDEIRTLNREYGIDFQSHTWSHQTLAGEMIDESPIEERTEEWYKRELVESKTEIERQLNLWREDVESCRLKVEGCGEERKRVVVDELCFPVGNFSDDVIRRCKAAGYRKVYASYPGNITDDYIQPRCLVQDLGVMGFKAVLNGGMNPMKNRYLAMHYKK